MNLNPQQPQQGAHIVGYYICRPPILDTFELPTREELLNIEPGDFVKLIFSSDEVVETERMWVKVIKIVETYGYGELDNEPILITSLSPGDIVKFHLGDVIDIMKKHEIHYYKSLFNSKNN